MKKKFLAVMMAAAMLLGIGGGLQRIPQAEAAQTYSNLTVSDESKMQIPLVPDQTIEVEIPVRAVKDYIYNPKFSVELPENAPFEIGKIELYRLVNGEKQTNLKDISQTSDTIVHFSVTTKETAKIGKYEFILRYEDYYWDGTVITEGSREYAQSVTLTGVVTEEKLPAELAISALSVSGELRPGSIAEVSFTVTNTGEIEAKNVCLSADYSAGVLLPDYTDYTRKLGNMKQKDSKRVSLRVKVLDSVAQPVVTLPLQITYKDSEGTAYAADANNILYLEVDIPKQSAGENGTLLVNNVRQTPAAPKAGEKVALTFDMENTGKNDFTEAKLYIAYTPNTGFEPVNAEPYQYVGTIKAGQKKTVTVEVLAGNEIAAGMNTLGVNYTYLSGSGEKLSENVDLYVLNVQKKEDTLGNSRPKLMVSEFTTDVEQIKSGEEFDFTFDVYNTHSDTTAKNIKVTVTSEMFSVTKGSNSFFLQGIEPGQKEAITINLKASAAATTGSYPINIQLEYEYDGMPATEANGNGVVVTETKMLLIKENLRVSVENVAVGGWMTPYANQTTQLSFSVYNMGKSVLNNVYFTVEGDFAVANGSS
ncbi:MAG: COG1361 S-layer family protein, partial [Lachnospiraceae bacterium]